MNEFLAGTLSWMVEELILSGAVFFLYLILRHLAPAASDRYQFLRVAFPLVVFLPWMRFSWLTFLPNDMTSAPSTAVSAAAIKIQPFVAAASSTYYWLAVGVISIYFAGVVYFLARLAASLVKLHQLAAASTFAFNHEGIPVYATREDLPPATFGLFRPIILLPETLVKQVSATELQMILQHERHHIRRRDYLSNLIKAVVQSLLVFSPFAHRLAGAFVEEMELSCDALVVRLGRHDVKDYGGLLLRLTNELRPRMDLVYSGLFASNAFISRRIAGMRTVQAKSRTVIWLTSVGLLAIVAGPTVASLGIEAAIEHVTAQNSTLGYQANLILGNGKKASASGHINLSDGTPTEMRLGALQVRITPHKMAKDWKFEIDAYDPETKISSQKATIITSETEGAQIATKDDEAKGDQVKAFSLSLSPTVAKSTLKTEKSAGLIQKDGMVTLNFKDPTDVKDVIKSMALLSGKNIILSRDIDSKITVVSDHPMPKEDAYQAFIAALAQVDVVAVDEGKAVRLVRKQVSR